jgi:uncharacterized protein YkvS
MNKKVHLLIGESMFNCEEEKSNNHKAIKSKKNKVKGFLYFLIGGKKMIFKAKKIAELGDYILFKNGMKGIVEKVNENSVIVNIIDNKTEMEFEGNRTVVSHKNYKVIECV